MTKRNYECFKITRSLFIIDYGFLNVEDPTIVAEVSLHIIFQLISNSLNIKHRGTLKMKTGHGIGILRQDIGHIRPL